MQPFEKGDVVRLKSGGPKMTVDEVEESQVYCVWFDDKNTRKQDRFEAATLEAAASAGNTVLRTARA